MTNPRICVATYNETAAPNNENATRFWSMIIGMRRKNSIARDAPSIKTSNTGKIPSPTLRATWSKLSFNVETRPANDCPNFAVNPSN